NESIPTPVTITVDTVAPPAPTVTAPISGTAVMTNTPTFAGMGEPGGEVTVYDDEGTVVCTATVDPSGNWTCTPTTPLDEGEQTYEVTVTDEAGNESTPTPITITVDTVAPPAPTVTEPISDTTVTDPTPAFAGTAEPGTTVIVGEMQGTVWVVLCEAVADENGNWACTPTTPLDNGEHTVTVVAVDEAGNESDPTTLIFTVEAALQAEDDTYTVPEGIPSTLDVLANDSTSGGPLTITQVSAPQYGVAVTDGATIVYTPTLEYLGTDTFTYTITDGEVQDTAQVTVTVSPVADLEVSQQVKGTIGGLEITLVARNLGPRPAGGAVISDTFPTILSNVTWTCAASGGAVCPNTSGTGDLDETLTTFPANGVVTYTVSAKFVLLSIIENNTVTITPPAGMFDLVMSNNTATRPTLYRIILPLVVRNALP
ncbi:MAG: cadherin-like domain-containing protein, partial [Anaerolineae bacterium]|nr:cadherin-like domain-containing protein [Anaerolineae bacterium]